jgi:hypothetical protein
MTEAAEHSDDEPELWAETVALLRAQIEDAASASRLA